MALALPLPACGERVGVRGLTRFGKRCSSGRIASALTRDASQSHPSPHLRGEVKATIRSKENKMAKIVLGMATSHGPLLSTPPEQWGERAKADRVNPALWFRGQPYKYDALEALRTDEKLDPKWELAERQ